VTYLKRWRLTTNAPFTLRSVHRPEGGTRPDLGADEIAQRRIYLPLVLRNG